MALAAETKTLLETLGCFVNGGDLAVHSPINGSYIGAVATATVNDIHDAVEKSNAAFLTWRNVPAPRRGELVRLFGNALRAQKNDLARLTGPH
jgi:aldehyde dehydrogenase (NAD+)